MTRLLASAFAALTVVPLACARREAEEPGTERQPETPTVAVRPADPKPAPKPLPVAPMPHLPGERIVIVTAVEKWPEVEEKDLTNKDPGLQPGIEAVLPDVERLDRHTVDLPVTNDPLGVPLATDVLVPTPAPWERNQFGLGAGGAGGMPTPAFPGRTGATKARLLKENGGNAASEQAVALGLAWLARQQKADGSWTFDGTSKNEVACATGMALLPFLGAGETHKGKGKYQKNVAAGLNFLMNRCPPSGRDAGRLSTNMYAQAIATLALCEAYGMTKDPTLRPYAQAAVNYIQKAQGNNGSWGYQAQSEGDTSIVGWQLQALHAAKLTKDLVVDERVIAKAMRFLDSVAAGSRKAMYGYSNNKDAKPGTALTAVGLLSRYSIDGWGPNSPGMVEGASGLLKNGPAGKGAINNLYYYYYATQVVRFYEGEDWKIWNEGPKGVDGTRKGGMRDWLVTQQIDKDATNPANVGSWAPESGQIGMNCGRLGTTALSLLTLEVYYRHLPLYKRDSAGPGIKILDDK